MSGDLTTMLLDSLDKEARRFASEHPGAETLLYERAITPRRRARRLVEASAALVAVAAVAFGGYALATPHDAVEPARPTATPTPTPVATAPAPLQDRAWAPPGDLEVGATVAELRVYWNVDVAALSGCGDLDDASRLRGEASLGGAAVPLGVVADEGGGRHAVVVRDFATAADARAYLDAVEAAAGACDEDAAAVGLTVDSARVGIQSIGGEGIRVEVAPATDALSGTWSTWVHVRGTEAVAVTSEGGGGDLVTRTIVAWFAAQGG